MIQMTPAAALVATEHSPPAYLHMAVLGGIVVAALVVFGIFLWRRRHQERMRPPEEQ